MQKINTKRLASLKAAPIGVEVIKKGAPAPDHSDLPIADVPVYDRVLKEPKDHLTIADRLDYMCDALGGAHHYREYTEDGQIILKVKLPDMTILAGKGKDTVHAYNDLAKKVTAFAASLENLG